MAASLREISSRRARRAYVMRKIKSSPLELGGLLSDEFMLSSVFEYITRFILRPLIELHNGRKKIARVPFDLKVAFPLFMTTL